jgi:hypothetical protein
MAQGFIIIHGMGATIIIITIRMALQYVITLIMGGALVFGMAHRIIGMVIRIGVSAIIIGDLHIIDRLITVAEDMLDHHIPYIMVDEVLVITTGPLQDHQRV